MQSIFKGLLFLFFNFHITIDSSVIGLIPDFYGYYLIWKGFHELSVEHAWFGENTKWIQVMGVFTGIQYGLAVLGFSSQIGVVSTLIELGNKVGSLYVLYLIMLGVKVLEQQQFRNLQGKKLQDLWMVLAVLNIVAYVFGNFSAYVMGIGMTGGILILLGLVMFVCHICYLVTFSRTKDIYYGRSM